jgi:hypothetical protein
VWFHPFIFSLTYLDGERRTIASHKEALRVAALPNNTVAKVQSAPEYTELPHTLFAPHGYMVI